MQLTLLSPFFCSFLCRCMHGSKWKNCIFRGFLLFYHFKPLLSIILFFVCLYQMHMRGRYLDNIKRVSVLGHDVVLGLNVQSPIHYFCLPALIRWLCFINVLLHKSRIYKNNILIWTVCALL